MPKLDSPNGSGPVHANGKETPNYIKSFTFHGVAYGAYREGDTQAIGDCPFCRKEAKFYISKDTGQWDCKVCGERGNLYSFIQRLWAFSLQETTTAQYEQLAQDRKMLSTDVLVKWGLAYSVTTSEWILPGYSADGKLNNLYAYRKDRMSGKFSFWATTNLTQGLFGVHLFEKDKPDVYLAEGPWDAMAAWEVLTQCKEADGKLLHTGSPSSSLYAVTNVLAVPGSKVFNEKWASLLSNKNVFLTYDNDHPKKIGNRVVQGSGLEGMIRVSNILGTAEVPPESINYIRWGEHGWSKDLADGWDVRDTLTSNKSGQSTEAKSLSLRISKFNSLRALFAPIPDDWIPGRTKESKKSGGVDIELLPCSDWKTLQQAWKLAFKWHEGLDRTLPVMLAVISSTESVGDQLWSKIIGPASCGKSTLCEACSTNKKYTLPKSTIRGFHSGYTDGSGEEDNSLLSLLNNKTLITKDGDTLLQSPNLAQILAEGRDVYDRVSRTHYRNKASRNYEGVNMTWLLCGTASLRAIDSSELGERFLDCVVVDEIDHDQEHEIALRVAFRAARELPIKADGKIENRDVPEMARAKQLTGGYIEYLRQNAQTLLNEVEADDISMGRCVKLATLVAYMRARPSLLQKEKAEREMNFRLTSQLVRLSMCLAVVLNKKKLDQDVMKIVNRVALDTARGKTLELAAHLYKAGAAGAEAAALAIWTNDTEDNDRTLLRFLSKIGVVESFRTAPRRGLSATGPARWRLTDRFNKLYTEVIGNATIVTKAY